MIRMTKIKTYMDIKYLTTMLMERNYEISDDFLSEYQQNYLRDNLSQLELEENPLSDIFYQTRGKMIKFNIEEMTDILAKNNMEFISSFIDSLRIPEATDFVFNILEINPMKISEREKSSPKMSVGYHMDNTCELNRNRDWKQLLPCSVFVYYFDCPKNMKNGKLILRDFCTKKIIQKIVPKKNRLVEFKGDLYHGIETMYNLDENDDTKRISLVLEQYVVPEDFIDYSMYNERIPEHITTHKENTISE